MNTALSVNLNKIALIRNSREGNYPDVVAHGKICLAAGADGLTVHPRPDQRHIRPHDVYDLAELLKDNHSAEFNIEGNPFAEKIGDFPGFIKLVLDTKPEQCTLVPDSNDQLTSDHGFDLKKCGKTLKPILDQLKTAGVRVSLFMDPDVEQIELAKELGADRIELYTGPYAEAYKYQDANFEQLFQRYFAAAEHAAKIGIGLNAGHDLNLDNLAHFRKVPELLEVSIGHALTVDAIAMGLDKAVRAYKQLCITRHKESLMTKNNDINKERGDSQAYLEKKKFFDGLLTIYGRKPVLEALQDKATNIHRLHLAESNKSAEILDDIIKLAKAKGAEILYHDRSALSRISKNSSQDQGVAADLVLQGFQTYDAFLQKNTRKKFTLLALDGVNNPQNLGMIIRSACAGNIDGILLPQQGTAQIDPLVIKSSAGTVFRASILRCKNLAEALKEFKSAGSDICSLSSHAKSTLKEFNPQNSCIYVLGNETEGVSKEISQLCNESVRIPMNNGVESLNVAVTAALIAFL